MAIKTTYTFAGFTLIWTSHPENPNEPIVFSVSPEHLKVQLQQVRVLRTLLEHYPNFVSRVKLHKEGWGDSANDSLDVQLSHLRKILGNGFIESGGKGFWRFVVKPTIVRERILSSEFITPGAESPLHPQLSEGGALPLDSTFYVVRPQDRLLADAIDRGSSIIVIKGPRQVGKTSLLARGLQHARQTSRQVFCTDFQAINSKSFQSIDALLSALAEMIAEDLDLDVSVEAAWNHRLGAGKNFERFIRRTVLGMLEGPVVWAMDEVDTLFEFDYASEVFGMFRTWHNARALQSEKPWKRLTLVIACATEAHLYIRDHQSPFNVGTRLELPEFDSGQIAQLNRRYRSPLRDPASLDRFYRSVGGHPFLVQSGLHALAEGLSLEDFEQNAASEDGLFGDHLRKLYSFIRRDEALFRTVQTLVHGGSHAEADAFYRLQSAGVITGTNRSGRFRCGIYDQFFQQKIVTASADETLP